MKYSGPLSEPVVPARLGPLADDSAIAIESTRIAGEIVSKMPLLFEAHGIEEGNYAALAMALAIAHVPGFKVIRPAGRPMEWGLIEKAELRAAVDQIKARRGRGLEDAIREILKAKEWSPLIGGLTVSAVKKHYNSAQDWACKVMEKALKYQEEMGGR